MESSIMLKQVLGIFTPIQIQALLILLASPGDYTISVRDANGCMVTKHLHCLRQFRGLLSLDAVTIFVFGRF